MEDSVNSQSRDLEAKLDSLLSEVTGLTFHMEKISEKMEAMGFAGQSDDSSSNYSQKRILKTKLDKLISEISNLSSVIGNVLESVGTYKDSAKKLSNSQRKLKYRFRILDSSVFRLQNDRSVQSLENRLSSLEKSLDEQEHSKDTNLNAIESRLKALESSQNELHLIALDSFESRLSKLESTQNQITEALEKRLRVLETSVNKLQYQELSAIETRFDSLESSIEERQDADKAEAHNNVHELATVVDVLCNDNLSNEEANTAKEVAERFGMRNTVSKLTSFCRNTLTLITCIQLFKDDFEQTLITHRNAALKMILQNFNTVAETAADFCELSLEELRCLLCSNELSATAEQMFNTISKWVEKDRLSRTSMASLLLPAVQFSRCSLTFLRFIRDDFLVKGHITVQHAVEEAIKNFGSDVLFVLGGDDSKGIIETLNKSKSSWIKQNNISNGPSRRTFAFTAEHHILVLDMSNLRFRSFDTFTKKWNDLQPLPSFRVGISAALEGNELFVMGGLGHESRCDVYDIHLDSWTQASRLNVGRGWSASSSLNGKVYCCGGRRLSSMEMFDPNEKSSKGWTMKASMSVEREGHCLVSCGKYLWAVGGYKKSYLTDLERFEHWNNAWTKMASMPTGRSHLTASFFGDRLYAIGGVNMKSLKTVEVYNPCENNWTKGVSLNRKRNSHASCVVKEMPNAYDYQCYLDVENFKCLSEESCA